MNASILFCKSHNIPLITTYKGKGLLDEDDPLCIAGAGLSPLADKVLLPLIAEADTILLLGYDPIEMRIGWRNPWHGRQTIIEICPTERAHGMHRVDMSLVGDVSETLAELNHDTPKRWGNGRAEAARADLRQAFAGPITWGPHAVFRGLRAARRSHHSRSARAQWRHRPYRAALHRSRRSGSTC